MKAKPKGENTMSYNKPEVVLLSSAVKAIQTANPKNVHTATDGQQSNGFSANAYEADE